jgi:Flp pilus assembly protein TadG
LKFRHEQEGTSVVEFTIVITLLFLVLFGIIQFGIAYNRYQGLQAAAREGARISAVGATVSQVVNRAREAQSLFTPTDVAVRLEYSLNDGATWTTVTGTSSRACQLAGVGRLVQVTATVDPAVLSPSTKYAIAIPLWGNRAVKYESSGRFRCEQTGA